MYVYISFVYAYIVFIIIIIISRVRMLNNFTWKFIVLITISTDAKPRQ